MVLLTAPKVVLNLHSLWAKLLGDTIQMKAIEDSAGVVSDFL